MSVGDKVQHYILRVVAREMSNFGSVIAHIESHILVKFIPVLTKLCSRGLKFSDLFCAFFRVVLGFSCAKNYG